jgi:hypothetical protein
MIFTYRLEFSCFADFFKCIFKTKVESGFLKKKSASRKAGTSMEQKTLVFCPTDQRTSSLDENTWALGETTRPGNQVSFILVCFLSVTSTHTTRPIVPVNALIRDSWSEYRVSQCSGSVPGTHLIRIQIQHFWLNTDRDPDPGFWCQKI